MSPAPRIYQLKYWLQQVLIRLRFLIKGEIAHLFSVKKSQRPWHMPIVAAIAISFPVFVGAYFWRFAFRY